MAFESGDQDAGGGGIMSRFSHKYGPLPLWGWMGLILAAALLYASWKSKKTAAAQSTTADSTDTTGGNQEPPVVFQDYTTIFTGPGVPPGGGREHPPVAPPVTHPPVVTPGGGGTGSPPTPVTPPGTPPASPAGEWVTVSKWTKDNPPWSSTLWGIAKHYGYGGTGTNYASIWDAPQNASEKARRKDPKKIQPGDKIFVPAK
jgi:hypothetical protein